MGSVATNGSIHFTSIILNVGLHCEPRPLRNDKKRPLMFTILRSLFKVTGD